MMQIIIHIFTILVFSDKFHPGRAGGAARQPAGRGGPADEGAGRGQGAAAAPRHYALLRRQEGNQHIAWPPALIVRYTEPSVVSS